MLKRILAAMTVFSFAIVCMLLFTTTPSEAGPLGILIFFVFMYLSALGTLTFLFHAISNFTAKIAMAARGKATLEHLSFRKSYYYASAAALTPVMLLAMQSVNQVGIYQLLLVLFFVIVAWVYISKRTL
jgi:hypothetical protein